MAKFYGAIGYAITEETSPGIWEEKIKVQRYYGDLIQNIKRTQSTDNLNDDINISNKISIVADPFANNNFHSMRYVEYLGTKWKILSVDVQFPRLVLTLGGVYNA